MERCVALHCDMEQAGSPPTLSGASRLFLVIAAVSAIWMAVAPASDFRVYWTAGRDLYSGRWDTVYRVTTLVPYKYHPAFAFFFAPLGALPFPAARIAWALLNGAALLDMQHRWHRCWHVDAAAIGAGFLGLALALTWQLELANVTFLMLWLWTVAATSHDSWGQALCYALLIALKPFWLALVVPWLLGRRAGLIGRVVLVIIVLSLLPGLLGPGGLQTAYARWFATFADPLHQHNFPKLDNQSWYALLFRHRESLAGRLPLLWLAGSGGVGLLWFWPWRRAWRSPVSPDSAWALELSMIPVMLWAAPLSWIHHQLLLWPLLALMWQAGRSDRSSRLAWAGVWVLLNGTGQLFLGRAASMAITRAGVPILAFPLLASWSSRRYGGKLAAEDRNTVTSRGSASAGVSGA
jgi:hypothetical protein